MNQKEKENNSLSKFPDKMVRDEIQSLSRKITFEQKKGTF